MAEDDRKATRGKGKQPISRHPLFPATVAIWFGALFGLGSLAIGPAVLESAVLATHIDSLIPATAPPLGITARILLALTMAGVGGLIGATIARRINRVKPPLTERKRGAMGALGRKAAEPTVRRRSLAIDETNHHREFEEHAPLPGGTPQILNVSDFAFDEPAAPDAVQSEAARADALDLAAFQQEMAPKHFPEPTAPLDRWSGPDATAFEAVVEAPATTTPLELSVPELAVPELAPYRPFAAQSDHCDPATPRAFDTPAEFGPAASPFGERPFAAPVPDVAPARPQIEIATEPDQPADELRDAPAENDVTAPSSSVIAAYSQAASSAPPLFGATHEVSDTASAALTEANAPRPFDDATHASARQFDPPAAMPEPELQPDSAVSDLAPVSKQPAAPEPLVAGALPQGTNIADKALQALDTATSPRLAAAELGALSQVELLERLAMSLKRRNARTKEAEANVTASVLEVPVESARPSEAAMPVPTVAMPVTAMPVTATPIDFGTSSAAELAPQLVDHIPAALRPIDFDGPEIEDSLPGFLPPRRIALETDTLPQASQPAPFAPTFVQSPAAQPDPADDHEDAADSFDAPHGNAPSGGEEESDEDGQTLEDGYSSLLNLSRPGGLRQQFVRIEEPEPDAGEVEPVVIFPGQHAAGAPLAAVPYSPAPEGPVAASSGPRPFDAPDSATIPARPVQQDPEETERALRAALASLQRMSGAA